MGKMLKRALLWLKKRYYLLKYPKSQPGSVAWLVGTEAKYGGFVSNVSRNKVSPKDPRTKEQLSRGGMVGGDRMLHHGYAEKYSEYLLPVLKKGKQVTLTEVGILKGTGLAIWCDLFQNGRIIGLDIDLGHINQNQDNLTRLGAFKKCQPELHEFDQLMDNADHLRTILNGSRIDICIDDGLHSDESILRTMKSVVPFLADEFAYFIEDNKDVHKNIKSLYPDFDVDSQGRLTIVSKNVT